MTQISAAENLMIEADATHWQLLSFNELGEETEVLRVTPNGPLTFSADFALTRRLPSAGRLSTKYVRMVILGWSHDDETWHLGVLLVKELADLRGSRWCEIASWPDPDPNVFQSLAQKSGESLAQMLNVPFHVVAPREDNVGTQPELPLPSAPISLGHWRMERPAENHVALVRSRGWVVGRMLRVVWYSALAGIYLLLSIATLKEDLALPNSGLMLPSPQMLPYLGIVAAIVSALIALYALYELLFKINRIEIDGTQKTLRAYHGTTEKWAMAATDYRAIYVTHVLKFRRKRAYIDYGEINLLLPDKRFQRIIQQIDSDEPFPPELTVIEDGVQPLRANKPLSGLQATGLTIARTLGGIPAWYDQRES